ncbi:MAG: tripartite tricarboxylate transporter substrate binding protein [Thermodesulfobacteriota bacterium]
MFGVITAPLISTAADFPTKPVTLYVPWTAGGSTDVVLRVLAEIAAKHLGQPIVIENKPGGGGTIGAATMVATAKPDGYTISQIPITVFRYPLMMKTTWDPLKDFSYIIHLTGYTFGVVVKKDAPWKTFNDLVAYAKANPGKVTYATPGAGTSLHTTMEMIALKNGFKWTQVPMKGSAETVPAVLGGHVMATADSSSWAPQVDAGNLRLLVTWGVQRTQKWPTVPTLKELGYGIISNSPFGLAGPKGMDPKVVKILHDAFKKAMDDPAFQKTLDKFDMEPYYMNTENYNKFVKQIYDDEKEIVEKLGMVKK